MRRFIFNLLFIAFCAENLAHACATCGFNDESNAYFLRMIIVMTSVPVLLVGSVVYYLKKHRDKGDSP